MSDALGARPRIRALLTTTLVSPPLPVQSITARTTAGTAPSPTAALHRGPEQRPDLHCAWARVAVLGPPEWGAPARGPLHPTVPSAHAAHGALRPHRLPRPGRRAREEERHHRRERRITGGVVERSELVEARHREHRADRASRGSAPGSRFQPRRGSADSDRSRGRRFGRRRGWHSYTSSTGLHVS